MYSHKPQYCPTYIVFVTFEILACYHREGVSDQISPEFPHIAEQGALSILDISGDEFESLARAPENTLSFALVVVNVSVTRLLSNSSAHDSLETAASPHHSLCAVWEEYSERVNIDCYLVTKRIRESRTSGV